MLHVAFSLAQAAWETGFSRALSPSNGSWRGGRLRRIGTYGIGIHDGGERRHSLGENNWGAMCERSCQTRAAKSLNLMLIFDTLARMISMDARQRWSSRG